MGATITKLANKTKNLAGSLKEFPLESALCITYFLIWVFRASIGSALKSSGPHVGVEQFFVWFVPQFVLCFFLHLFKDRHRLLAGIALIIGIRKMDNVAFGRHIIGVGIKLAEGLLIGILLWGIIYAVIASVDFLFGLPLKEGWYSYPSIFNWLVFTPLLCCTLLSDSSSFAKVENLLRIVVDRVLSIALIIYSVILYGYIIRPPWTWTV